MDELFKKVTDSIKQENEDKYKEATNELLGLGYLPKIGDNELELVFVGPVTDLERKSHENYLENLYKTLVEEYEEEDDNDYKPNTLWALGIVGVVIVAIVAITVNSRNKPVRNSNNNDWF